MLLAAGGVAFKDTRMKDDDTPVAVGNTDLTWDEAKKAAPFGQAPYLKVGGDKILPQSRACERYAAKLGNLLGASDFDAAWIDAIQEQVRDVWQAYRTEGTDEAKKKAFIAGLATHSGVAALAKYAGAHFLVGQTLSYADVALFQFLHDTLEPVDPAAFDAHLPAALKAHKAHIAAVPAIAKYLAARPPRPW